MRITAVLSLLLLLATSGARADVRVEQVNGVLSKAEIGNDTSVIHVAGMRFVNGVGDFEDASPADRAAYEAAMKRTPGRVFPTYGDLGARVTVYYVRRNNANVLLKYQVRSRPPQTWFVIIASETESTRAHDIKYRAYDKGLPGDVVQSADYPRLRPGYWVVVVGAFPDSASAASTLAKAKAAGWTSAYVRRAR